MSHPIPLPPIPAPADAQRWRRAFPGDLDQACAARRFTAALLAGCPELDEMLLAVDELVVNALRHTKSGQPGGTFTVEIARWDGVVAICVGDEGGPSEPAVTDAADDAESGRGLRTVSLLASGWGWFGNDRSRTVAALFSAASLQGGGVSGRDLREWTTAQVRSAMTAAMRTDPDALDALAERNAAALDPYSLSFLRTARMLTLATSAALTTVLSAHRYGRDDNDRLICLACRTGRCRTVRAISDVLTAYALQAHPVDRPEAWRRADAWYTHTTGGRPVLLSIEPFDRGFIARPAASPPEVPDRVLVIDRDTAALTLWPAYDTDTLASQYGLYRRGEL